MDISDVIEVVHLTSRCEINDYLSLGWKIIETAGGRDVDGGPYILYSVGWFNQSGEVEHPKSKYEELNWD